MPKIKVAYIGADTTHITYKMMEGVFIHHDKERFEIYYADILHTSETAIKEDLRNNKIDIAVDLMGYTLGCNPTFFKERIAPIQINYLGYPATMGASYMDYIIADPFVIPPELAHYYSEKPLYLPCFQANDDRRYRPTHVPVRNIYNLPEDAFVFCCHNHTCKITPEFFDVWMRLLHAVPNSVLWLLGDETVQRNFRAYAAQCDISPDRLIFATRVPYEEHLTRLQCADLFLDTLPFNAGATASDALWVGLPVLTMAGENFASRMAGSLLTALDLPELITYSIESYRLQALLCSLQPSLLAAQKEKLIRNRHQLFNTAQFTRNLENALVSVVGAD